MDLLQASGAPVLVQYGKDGRLAIPKYEMQEIIDLGNELKAERVQEQTKDMDAGQRSQHLSMYPPLAPDMVEIKRYVRTPEGMVKLCRTKLKHAILSRKGQPNRTLSTEEIEKILRAGVSVLGPLAWELSDLEEKKLAVLPPDNDGETNEGNSSTGSGTNA